MNISGRDAERLAYVGRSQQRMAVARQRKSRQWRNLWLIMLCLIVGGGVWFWLRGDVPEAPGLVVRWSKTKVEQRISSGSMLLARRGAVFSVTLTDTDKWSAFWQDGKSQSDKPEFRWQPTAQNATLTVRCRAKVSGFRQIISWFWRQPELTLQTMAPQSAGNGRFKIAPPKGGLWLYPFVYAKNNVTWDEDALQLLTEPLLPALRGTLNISSPAMVPASTKENVALDGRNSVGPDQPLWWIVPSFDTKAAQPAPTDNGTYASLNSRQPVEDMEKVALLIAAKRPQASFRYVVRLDETIPHAILRIAFDGKADRKAWIRRKGEASGGPIVWPESNSGQPLAPRAPR